MFGPQEKANLTVTGPKPAGYSIQELETAVCDQLNRLEAKYEKQWNLVQGIKSEIDSDSKQLIESSSGLPGIFSYWSGFLSTLEKSIADKNELLSERSKQLAHFRPRNGANVPGANIQ